METLSVHKQKDYDLQNNSSGSTTLHYTTLHYTILICQTVEPPWATTSRKRPPNQTPDWFLRPEVKLLLVKLPISNHLP